MAEHTQTVIEKKLLTNGQISVLIRCCADERHQSWHTLGVTPSTTSDTINAWLEGRKAAVQAQHEAMLAAAAHLDSLTLSAG